MANNFSKILIHLILAVKNPEALINNGVKNVLYKHINDTIKNKEQSLLAINGMPDHVHIFLGLNTDVKVSDLVRDIKSESSRFINENKLCRDKFHWQQGYGAFSYGQSQK
ncbi:MAG: IS200/IS605 family transposase, partial [Bacteroidales bacterium]|nr:IS200/IS605 family transposase [Bacteroidales bacterium]